MLFPTRFTSAAARIYLLLTHTTPALGRLHTSDLPTRFAEIMLFCVSAPPFLLMSAYYFSPLCKLLLG